MMTIVPIVNNWRSYLNRITHATRERGGYQLTPTSYQLTPSTSVRPLAQAVHSPLLSVGGMWYDTCMISNVTIVVSGEEAGKRLDVVLAARFPSSSRAFCKEAVLRGGISVNGKLCRNKGEKLTAGQILRIEQLLETADNRVQPDPSVWASILFEDESLVAVNKPAGMPVQPLKHQETGTLMNGLVNRYPELADVGDQPLMAGALHRIDTETSGVVMAARTQEAFREMRRQFQERLVTKVYVALVEGNVALPGTLQGELAHDPTVPYCRMVDAARLDNPDRRMYAETSFRPVEWIGAWTLLEVTIRTGVTHQIRCQLAENGIPIVGDALYGARPRADTSRHFLHAFSISFEHPKTKIPCRIEAPLTGDFERFLEEARGG